MTDHKGQKEHWKYALIVYKGVFVDGLNDRFKGDLGGQSVTVLDHRLPVWTVPTVHCNTESQTGLKKTKRVFLQPWTHWYGQVSLTLHTAAAGLQDPRIHVRLGVGQ